jgi:hypothetical protein
LATISAFRSSRYSSHPIISSSSQWKLGGEVLVCQLRSTVADDEIADRQRS